VTAEPHRPALRVAASRFRGLLIGLGVSVAAAGVAHGAMHPCRRGGDQRAIASALRRIRTSVDPCGESSQVLAVFDRLERCRRQTYEICTSTDTWRNLFDRAPADGAVGTITWNPLLRSELEPRCRRDPTASLLHELVHAADDCEGRNPGTRELEAVRIENIYRRAARLCQRSGYGGERLGLATVGPSGFCVHRTPP
jgi:hypothetical protein